MEGEKPRPKWKDIYKKKKWISPRDGPNGAS